MGKKEDTSFEPEFAGIAARARAPAEPELSEAAQKLGANQRLRFQVPTENTLLQLGYKGDAENGFQAGISALTNADVLVASRNSTVTIAGKSQVLLASTSGHLFAQANESAFVGAGSVATLAGAGGAFVGGGVSWPSASIEPTADAPEKQEFPSMSEAIAAETAAVSSANSTWAVTLSAVYTLGLELDPIDAVAAFATWGAFGAQYAQGGETTIYGNGGVTTVSPGKIMTMGVKTSMLAQVKAMVAAPMVTVGGAKAELVSATKTTLAGGVKAALVSGAVTEVASRQGTAEMLGRKIEVGSTHAKPPQAKTQQVDIDATNLVNVTSEKGVQLEGHEFASIQVGDYAIYVDKDKGVKIDKQGEPAIKLDGKKIQVVGDEVEILTGDYGLRSNKRLTTIGTRSAHITCGGGESWKVKGSKLELL